MTIDFKPLIPAYDRDLAALIRRILKAHHLDIPGTAFFDETLNHLSAFYDHPSRA